MKKLSQMNFEEGALAIGTISLAISEILEDKTISGILGDINWNSFAKKDKKGKPTIDNGAIIKFLISNGAVIVTKLIGLMCKSHFNSVVEILEVFTGKSQEEIKKSSIIEVMSDLKEIFRDEDFLKLFSTVQAEKNESLNS